MAFDLWGIMASEYDQLKTDILRLDLEYERLDRRLDRVQNDVSSLRNEVEVLRREVHAGFESLERMLLKALDR